MSLLLMKIASFFEAFLCPPLRISQFWLSQKILTKKRFKDTQLFWSLFLVRSCLFAQIFSLQYLLFCYPGKIRIEWTNQKKSHDGIIVIKWGKVWHEWYWTINADWDRCYPTPDLWPRWITTSEIWMIRHIIRKPNLILLLLLFFQNIFSEVL